MVRKYGLDTLERMAKDTPVVLEDRDTIKNAQRNRKEILSPSIEVITRIKYRT